MTPCRRMEERPTSLCGHLKGQAASYLVWPWPRPRSRRPRGTASPGRGLGPHRRPRPAALTCEPRPGPSITPHARPAAAPEQSGGRGSLSTPQPPLAHFRLAPRPPNCALPSAANPPREANPRPLSHGGGTFSPLENCRSSPPSAPPPLCSFLSPTLGTASGSHPTGSIGAFQRPGSGLPKARCSCGNLSLTSVFSTVKWSQEQLHASVWKIN